MNIFKQTNRFSITIDWVSLLVVLVMETILAVLNRPLLRSPQKVLLPALLYLGYYILTCSLVIPKLLSRQRKFLSSLLYAVWITSCALLVIVIGIGVGYGSFGNLSPGYVLPLLISTLFHCFFLFVVAFATVLLKRYVQQLRDSAMEAERRHAILMRLKDLEISRLHSIVDYHFVYNILYAGNLELQKVSPATARNFTMLSSLIRYNHSVLGRNEKVSLAMEIEQLENQWQLLCGMYPQAELNLQVDLPEAANQYLIMPQMMSEILQNMYKHGRLDIAGKPGVFRIEIMAGPKLLLTTRNLMKSPQAARQEGTGLYSLRTRLEYFYPGRHQLRTEAENDCFTLELSIAL